MTAIAWEEAAVHFADVDSPSTVDVELLRGEVCLVSGPTGSGKSAVLATINGAVPHTSPAMLTGRVHTMGRDTAGHPPRRLADVVAYVPARAADAFIATTVEDEVGYGLGRLHLSPAARSRRIDEVLASVGMAELRGRPLSALSAGQQRRVALAGALAAEPEVLVLDEPTAGLDPAGAAVIGQRLQLLARANGTTVVLAEHRAERVLERIDSVLYLSGDGEPAHYGPPADMLRPTQVAPPIIELSQLLRWDPPAITIAEALAAALTHPLPEPDAALELPAPAELPVATDEVVCEARGLTVRRGPLSAVRELDLSVRAGEIVALVGANGAGKSTLLQAFTGLAHPDHGTLDVLGVNPARLRGADRVRAVGLVPADPAELLLTDRVDRECAAADEEADVPSGRTAFVLDALLPGISPIRHPRQLSTGERQALALAIVLARGPRLILADEPTQGLDYPAKRRLVTMLRQLAGAGHAVVLATHDVEFTAALAGRVVTMADGAVTGDAGIADALRRGQLVTQVGQIMAPAPLFTVDDVRRELAG